MNLLQRFCVTLTAKKAAGRFYNSIDREAKLLKTMSSPKLDTQNTSNIKETVCGALSAPPVTDSRNSADADTDTQTVAKDDVTTDISGVDAEQPTDKEKPSMLSKRAARRVCSGTVNMVFSAVLQGDKRAIIWVAQGRVWTACY